MRSWTVSVEWLLRFFSNFYLCMHPCEWAYTCPTHTYIQRTTHTPAHRCTNMHTYMYLYSCELECTYTHKKNYIIPRVFLECSLDIWKIFLIILASLWKQRRCWSFCPETLLFSHLSAAWKYWRGHELAWEETQVFEIISVLFLQFHQYNSRMSWFYNHTTKHKFSHIWSRKLNRVMPC